MLPGGPATRWGQLLSGTGVDLPRRRSWPARRSPGARAGKLCRADRHCRLRYAQLRQARLFAEVAKIVRPIYFANGMRRGNGSSAAGNTGTCPGDKRSATCRSLEQPRRLASRSTASSSRAPWDRPRRLREDKAYRGTGGRVRSAPNATRRCSVKAPSLPRPLRPDQVDRSA
jgi:hypothetical protein